MPDTTTVVEYAIRYCVTRQSYAFFDGLELADAHWDDLSSATRRDVLEAWRSMSDWCAKSRFTRIAAAEADQ